MLTLPDYPGAFWIQTEFLGQRQGANRLFIASKIKPSGAADSYAVATELGGYRATWLHGYGAPGGGWVLPYKRLMGMCHWMGLHFHDWID